MAKGSCLCGAIAFEFENDGIVLSVGCFCTNCRKVSGSLYGVYLQIKPASFHWVSGEEQAIAYESSPGNKRAFCGKCGSVAPIATSYGAIRVPGGALDDDPGVVPDVILFERSKADWCTVDEGRQTFPDAGPPEFWGRALSKLYAGR